jgi:formylglycine-generating enzyme
MTGRLVRRPWLWVAVTAATSSACGETDLQCGRGTRQEGTQCIPESITTEQGRPDAAASSGSSGGAGPSEGTPSPLADKYPECVSDGFKGSPMAIRTTSDGIGYCIETTEVTQTQYQAFLTEPPGPYDQIADCVETEFDPPVESCFTPEETPNAPVACVSWCQATAYCRWAGKRLCGFTSRPELSPAELVEDPKLNEWLSACTNRGKRKYAYGNDVDAVSCPLISQGSYNVGQPDCVDAGGDVFELSGGVGEWIAHCSHTGGSTYVQCTSMGYVDTYDEEPRSCDASIAALWSTPNRMVGIRCCADPVQSE